MHGMQGIRWTIRTCKTSLFGTTRLGLGQKLWDAWVGSLGRVCSVPFLYFGVITNPLHQGFQSRAFVQNSRSDAIGIAISEKSQAHDLSVGAVGIWKWWRNVIELVRIWINPLVLGIFPRCSDHSELILVWCFAHKSFGAQSCQCELDQRCHLKSKHAHENNTK